MMPQMVCFFGMVSVRSGFIRVKAGRRQSAMVSAERKPLSSTLPLLDSLPVAGRVMTTPTGRDSWGTALWV